MRTSHLTLLVTAILASGCGGLVRQAKVTTEGLNVEYRVRAEDLSMMHGPIQVFVVDDREDKDPIGPGAKPTIGKHVLGYLLFGVAYGALHAAAPHGPVIAQQLTIPDSFKNAFVQRLSANGIAITDEGTAAADVFRIQLQRFRLDFSFGTWTAEASYSAQVERNGREHCRQAVAEKATKVNLWGYASGEAALSEVFNTSVNAFDPKSCTAGSA